MFYLTVFNVLKELVPMNKHHGEIKMDKENIFVILVKVK